MNYLIKFDRIGGNPANRDRVIEVAETDDPERIASAVALVIRKRKYLASRFFDVTVDLDAARVWIDGGRFGTGVITRLVEEPVTGGDHA
jgi:hypothetical protein